MKKIILALLMMVSLGAMAQTGRIKGNVKTSDQQPASYVNVALKGTTKGATTDINGSYDIKNVEAGQQTLVISFIGLESKEIAVEVPSGQTVTVSEIILAESSQKLDEVIVIGSKSYKEDVVSASLRLSTSILETPQNIQLVTGKALADQQVISMSDGVLRNVSGAVRMEHWGDLYTNVSMRGSQIQAFRNGFNVVNSYWGPLTEDMSFVDHIEFVKGPAGFMLANGDPSGLYNVVTKKPTGRPKGEASLTMGSFDLYRATLDLDGKLSSDGKLLYRLNLAGQNKGSHRPFEYNDRYSVAPVLSYQVDEKTKLTFEYTLQYAKMSDVGSFYIFAPDGFGTLPVDFTTMPPGLEPTKINDHTVLINAQHQLNDNWKLTAQASFLKYTQVGSSMWPTSVNADGTMIRSVGIWDAESNMTLAQAFVNGKETTGGIVHNILAGLDMGTKEYIADWSQSHALDIVGTEFDPKTPNYGPPSNGYPEFDRTLNLEARAVNGGGLMDQRYTGVYAQDELGFMDGKLRLTLAGRYTHLSQSAWGAAPDKADHFTPRVGVSVSANKYTSLYALYDQAFIPQSGRKSDGGKVQPITGNNMELGVKRDWADGRWNTTLAAYRILKNNELTADPNSPPNAGVSVELGQKQAQGIEFDLRGTVVNGLNLVANYAYTISEVKKVTEGVTVIEEGDIVPGFAKHTVNTWLNYRIQNGAFKGAGVSAGLTWMGDRKTYWDESPAGGSELADYFKVDTGLFWEKENFKVTANVFNVLDEYLYSGSWYSWLNAYNWQTEAPRNFRMTVTYKF
jgi:iron complex outermembrane recepter protein